MTTTQVQLAQLSTLRVYQPREVPCPCCRTMFVTESTNPKTKCPNCRRRRQPYPENLPNTRCKRCWAEIRVKAIRPTGNLCRPCQKANKREQAGRYYSQKLAARVHCPGHDLMVVFASTPYTAPQQMHEPGQRIALEDVKWQTQQGMYAPGARFERFSRAWVVVRDEFQRLRLKECK